MKAALLLILFPSLLSAGDIADFMDQHACPVIRTAEESKYAAIAPTIAAIAAIESGWGRASWVCAKRQLWGITEKRKREPGERPIDLLRAFPSVPVSTKWILAMFERRGFPRDRDGFLDRVNSSGYHGIAPEEYRRRIDSVEIRIRKNLRRCAAPVEEPECPQDSTLGPTTFPWQLSWCFSWFSSPGGFLQHGDGKNEL